MVFLCFLLSQLVAWNLLVCLHERNMVSLKFHFSWRSEILHSLVDRWFIPLYIDMSRVVYPSFRWCWIAWPSPVFCPLNLLRWNLGERGEMKIWLSSGKLTLQWNSPIFNRKYIFNPGPCSIAMLVYQSAFHQPGTTLPKKKWTGSWIPHTRRFAHQFQQIHINLPIKPSKNYTT